MRRKINFRVWDIKEQKYLEENIRWSVIFDKERELAVPFIIFATESPNYIVEQMTGLQDKNGVDIWEGDIIEDSTGRDYVYYKDGCFWAADTRLGDLAYCNQVISNIHENIELLK